MDRRQFLAVSAAGLLPTLPGCFKILSGDLLVHCTLINETKVLVHFVFTVATKTDSTGLAGGRTSVDVCTTDDGFTLDVLNKGKVFSTALVKPSEAETTLIVEIIKASKGQLIAKFSGTALV